MTTFEYELFKADCTGRITGKLQYMKANRAVITIAKMHEIVDECIALDAEAHAEFEKWLYGKNQSKGEDRNVGKSVLPEVRKRNVRAIV
jgi:hypothetical protein